MIILSAQRLFFCQKEDPFLEWETTGVFPVKKHKVRPGSKIACIKSSVGEIIFFEVVELEKWPCFNCRHYDTFDSHEEDVASCKIGRTVTHMNCDFQEPFSLASCDDFS